MSPPENDNAAAALERAHSSGARLDNLTRPLPRARRAA
jgi:hypothetical protein